MNPGPPLRLLIVDDHAMVREGLARSLEKEPGFEIAGLCRSWVEAAPLLRGDVSIVLLDVDLGEARALEFVAAAHAAGYQGRILIVTAGITGAEAVRLVQAGVAGIVHKHHSTEALAGVIRKVAAGESHIEADYVTSLFRSVDRTRNSGKPKLTERDRAILKAVFQGQTNKEIATRLQLSEGTIKASIRQLFDKLGVRTRPEAVKIALEQYRDQF